MLEEHHRFALFCSARVKGLNRLDNFEIGYRQYVGVCSRTFPPLIHLPYARPEIVVPGNPAFGFLHARNPDTTCFIIYEAPWGGVLV